MMHNRDRQEWKEFGYPSDYGPFLFNGKDKIPNLNVPSPFRDDFGIIDGNFGPLENLSNKKVLTLESLTVGLPEVGESKGR